MLAADANDANGCSGTSTPVDCGGTWNIGKRTHTLPNDEVIWDLGGNAWEWVSDNSGGTYGAYAQMSAVTATSHTTVRPLGTAKTAFGPYGDYSGKTASPYGGIGYVEIPLGTGWQSFWQKRNQIKMSLYLTIVSKRIKKRCSVCGLTQIISKDGFHQKASNWSSCAQTFKKVVQPFIACLIKMVLRFTGGLPTCRSHHAV